MVPPGVVEDVVCIAYQIERLNGCEETHNHAIPICAWGHCWSLGYNRRDSVNIGLCRCQI